MVENAQFNEIFTRRRYGDPARLGAGSRPLAQTAWDLGIDVVELPIQTPEDIEALRIVAAAGRERGGRRRGHGRYR